jgi:acyl carrier protein
MEEKLIYKIEILKALEDKFSIKIKDDEVEYIISFSDLIDLIISKKQNEAN